MRCHECLQEIRGTKKTTRDIGGWRNSPPGDDRSERVHDRLLHWVVGAAPALAARLEVFDKLVHHSYEHVGAVENLV